MYRGIQTVPIVGDNVDRKTVNIETETTNIDINHTCTRRLLFVPRSFLFLRICNLYHSNFKWRNVQDSF